MEKIISRLEYFNKMFPRKELEEAISRKDEITPILLDTLDKLVEHPEIVTGNSDYMLHMYALYLLAQFKEKKAFPKIISLISLNSDDIDIVLGDTITEGLSSILYSTYDGQLPLLQNVIENPSINIYVRHAALNVYAELYCNGALNKETVINYLRKLIYEEPYSADSDLATDIEGVVLEKHIFEMIDDIQYLYDEERIDMGIYGHYDEFIDGIYSYEYNREMVKYIDDAIAEMEWWACFEHTQGKHQQEEMNFDKVLNQMFKEEKEIQKPERIQNVKVGRNDPCPCGSGKKYKRCCLDKVEEKTDTKFAEDRRKWLKDYPKDDNVENNERQEGQVFISDIYDKESIEIDKSVYLALHYRPIPMWVKRDTAAEIENKIIYLTEASEHFLSKCQKESITSFDEYDKKYKIHYRSKEWFERFKKLLTEDGDNFKDDRKYNNILEKINKVILDFS